MSQPLVPSLPDREAVDATAHLQSIALEAAANAIVITDRSGLIQWVNSAFTRLTGYPRAEAIGHNPRLLKSGQHPVEFYQNLWETILHGNVWHGEIVNKRKDGSLYVEAQTITPVRSNGGEITHFIAIKQDVSKRVESDREIRQRNRELALLNRVIAAAASSLDPVKVLETTLRQVALGLSLSHGIAALLNEGEPVATVVAEYLVRIQAGSRGLEITLDEGSALYALMKQGTPLAIADAQQDPRIAPVHDLMRRLGLVSCLFIPLVVRERPLGFVSLATFERREFFDAEVMLATNAVSAVAQAIGTARLFDETRHRTVELEGMLHLSSALRQADTHADMLPLILDYVLKLLHTEGAALAVRDLTTGEVVTGLGRGAWAHWTEARQAASEGLLGQVIATAKVYVNNDVLADPQFNRPQLLNGMYAVAAAPLIAQEFTVGALAVGRKQPLHESEVRLLKAVADIAAGALHTTTLHEQTERRLRRIVALRSIDLTITSNQDLRVTLNVVLEQTLAQLGVDAAALLLFRPVTQTLEYAASLGFRTGALKHTHLRLGEGYAGRAALRQKLVHVPDLAQAPEGLARAPLLAAEGFVAYYGVPLIAKGQVKGVLEVFHRALLGANPEWMGFLEALAGQAAIAVDSANLFEELQHSNIELALAYDTTLMGWSHALDLRDRETEGHTQRVTELTLRLASVMGLGETERVHVRRGAILHDIGKMGIPDSILLKTSPLTDDEMEIMRRHPAYAYEWLSPISYLRPALDIPYCHHEKWDGTGYPRGLEGEQIPLAARLFAVIDVWDALRSDRPYHKAWPKDEAMAYLREQAGKYFDARVVEVFLRMVKDLEPA